MIIDSDFKDYYDVHQKHDNDRSIIFHRKKEQIEIKSKIKHSTIKASCKENLSIDLFFIGFCGKIYKGFNCSFGNSTEFIYDLDKLKEYFKSILSEKLLYNIVIPEFNYSKPKYLFGCGYYRGGFIFKTCEKFFKEKTPNCSEYFEKSPVFLISSSYNYLKNMLTLNPCLKDLEFMKVMNCYTAYQELVMYTSNIAVPFKEIPKVSDKDMLVAKGFDKYSFKKPKS